MNLFCLMVRFKSLYNCLNWFSYICSLFEQKPEYQEYFSFKDIPRKDLPNSPKFKAHAVTVMYALSSFIANLDETDIFMHLLKKNANSHIQKHIPAEAFDVSWLN